jgi:hypothetical protein
VFEILILVAGFTFVSVALVMFVREAVKNDHDDEISHADLKDAAGKGQSLTLTPDQCGQLYNQYRRANHDMYRVKVGK